MTLATAVLLSAALTVPVLAEPRPVTVVAGECLSVTTQGTGPDVVFVPGLLGATYGFRKVVPPLVAAGHRVTIVEPLGVGSSCRPKDADYSLTAQGDRIDAVLGAAGVQRAVIVAHSVAASMVFRLAYRHPARVAGIVSLEGGLAETVSTPGFRFAMRFAPLIRLFGGAGRIRGKVKSTMIVRSTDPSWVTDDVVAAYTAGPTRDVGAAFAALGQMSKAVEPELLGPRLGSVRCPVRLLLGAGPHEGGPAPPEVARMQAGLPSLTITRVPGAGHYLFEEAPGAVVEAVRALTGR